MEHMVSQNHAPMRTEPSETHSIDTHPNRQVSYFSISFHFLPSLSYKGSKQSYCNLSWISNFILESLTATYPLKTLSNDPTVSQDSEQVIFKRLHAQGHVLYTFSYFINKFTERVPRKFHLETTPFSKS